MAEVHHRVKNSLQLVQSMLGLQARAAVATEARRHWPRAPRACAPSPPCTTGSTVPNAGLEVEVASYLEGLVEDLRASMTSKREGREIRLEADPAIWAAAEVTTLGLVADRARHQCPEVRPGSRPRDLRAAAWRPRPVLIVEDEGPGVPADFDPARSRGLGMRLVTGLLSGHGGGLEIDRSLGHTRFVARLPHRHGASPVNR